MGGPCSAFGIVLKNYYDPCARLVLTNRDWLSPLQVCRGLLAGATATELAPGSRAAGRQHAELSVAAVELGQTKRGYRVSEVS